ncbi:MAG TPA: hypothetical protein VE007_00570 [Thermoanaerobaculia bacterium]|nr:hypothetical protein [Thermoanaerobaculia bacterium]
MTARAGAGARTPARAHFEAEYSPLASDDPSLGSAAVLPWDEEIFGFAVGDYRPASRGELASRTGLLSEALANWSQARTVELVGCRVPASDTALTALLESVGFRMVELQLRATLAPLRSEAAAPPRISVRTADPSDRARILEIASSALRMGRYHADPRFPRAAADHRYRLWMQRALAEGEGTWVAVAGPPGSVRGFLHAQISGPAADIRLAAVDADAAGIAGPELFRGAVHELSRRGVRRVTARMSAANCSVLNIYASLGFRFDEPESVLHWHSPDAPHLVSPDPGSPRP